MQDIWCECRIYETQIVLETCDFEHGVEAVSRVIVFLQLKVVRSAREDVWSVSLFAPSTPE